MATSHPDRNIRLLMAYWFMRDFQLWIPVWVVFLTIDGGFSLTQVTTAEGLFLIGVLLLEVPTGAVADRWGRTKSMGLGALALALAVLIFAFTNSFSILLVSFLMWSVASALMSGADMALLFDTLKAAGREQEYERLAGRGTALSWAGVALATALGGPVAALFDTRATIFFGAATCLVTATTAFSIWEPPHPRETGDEPPAYWASIPAAFHEAWRAVDVRLLILLAGTAFAALEAVHYLVQPYLVDRDVPIGTWFSLLQVPMLGAGFVGALLAGRVSARVGATRVFLVGPLLGGLAYMLLSLAPGLAAYAALPLIMAVSSCVEPVATGYINRRIGSERRATVLSISSMFRSLFLAGLAPGLGYATDQWGLREAFALGGGTAIAAGLIFGTALLWRARATSTEEVVGEPAAAG